MHLPHHAGGLLTEGGVFILERFEQTWDRGQRRRGIHQAEHAGRPLPDRGLRVFQEADERWEGVACLEAHGAPQSVRPPCESVPEDSGVLP